MELDINHQWIAFAFYSNSTTGADLLAATYYNPSRSLSGNSRDVIAVMAR